MGKLRSWLSSWATTLRIMIFERDTCHILRDAPLGDFGEVPQWDETDELLSDPVAMAELAEADEAIQQGDVVHGVKAVRELRQ